MKLTVGQVFLLVPMLTAVLSENRALPLKGKYRLTRLRAKLLPEWEIIANKRDEVIRGYGYEARPDGMTNEEAATMKDPPAKVPTVPPDKAEEFKTYWVEFAAEPIDVEVEPIPLSQLDMGGAVPAQLTGAELDALGDLIADDTPAAAKAA